MIYGNRCAITDVCNYYQLYQLIVNFCLLPDRQSQRVLLVRAPANTQEIRFTES